MIHLVTSQVAITRLWTNFNNFILLTSQLTFFHEESVWHPLINFFHASLVAGNKSQLPYDYILLSIAYKLSQLTIITSVLL